MKFTFRFLLFLLILYEFYATPITEVNERKLHAKRETDSKQDDDKSDETVVKNDKNKDNDDDDDDDKENSKEDDKSKEETTTKESDESETTTEFDLNNSNETETDKEEEKESGEKCKDKTDSDDESDECKEDKVSIESDTSPVDYKICGTEEADCKKLLIILVDGLRHDYIDRDPQLSAFEKIAERGVHIEQVRPVFPSNSIPNQYSIATGLYPDKHGIINDYMYDKKRKEVFTPDDYSEKFWWDDAEPIWITAKARKVAVYWWIGCELDIRGLPFRCSPYDDFNENKNHDDLFESRLKDIVGNFKANNYSLAMVHYEYVDYTGQKYGPESKQTRKAVRKLDAILDELLEEIEKQEMDEEMNVIILSDHGMTEKQEIIDLEKLEHFDENDFEMIVGNGAFVMLLPEKDRESNAYETLRNANVEGLNVYPNDKLKKRFRLRKNSLLLPIILTTDKGYLIQTPDAKGKTFPIEDLHEEEGFHGFDPQDEDDMNTLMYGFGPDFKKNYTLEFAKQVDFYNLFCHLLKIEKNDNDGSWSRLEHLLASDSDEESDEEDEVTTESSQEDEEESQAAANTNKDSGGNAASSIYINTLGLITVSLICILNQFKCNV